jgi:putative DNA primase/helicase
MLTVITSAAETLAASATPRDDPAPARALDVQSVLDDLAVLDPDDPARRERVAGAIRAWATRSALDRQVLRDSLVNARYILARDYTEQMSEARAAQRPAPRNSARAMQTFGAVKLADLALPHFTGRYRWCPELGWLVFDGARWIPDHKPRALREIVAVVKRYTLSLLENQPALSQEDCREIAGLSGGSTQKHALAILEGDPGINTDWREFDQPPAPGQPWTVPCANGVTVELYADGTRKARPTRPGDMNTRTACAYDPDAKAPSIGRALKLYQPDDDIRRWQLQMWCRALSGIGAENFIANIGAGGGNGKGTTQGLLSAVFGGYAQLLPVEVILKGRAPAREVYRSELASLRGCRYVYCEEPDEAAQYDVGVLKALTGGGEVQGRGMGKKEVTFPAKWLMEMAANSRPKWKADRAVDRRYVEIAWDFSVESGVSGGIREDFKEALKAEAPGFLNVILSNWYGSTRPPMPEVIRQQTETGNAAASPLATFRDEALVDIPGQKVKAGRLYAAYTEWARTAGVKVPMTSTAFGKELPRLGYEKREERDATYYYGLGLRSEP